MADYLILSWAIYFFCGHRAVRMAEPAAAMPSAAEAALVMSGAARERLELTALRVRKAREAAARIADGEHFRLAGEDSGAQARHREWAAWTNERLEFLLLDEREHVAAEMERAATPATDRRPPAPDGHYSPPAPPTTAVYQELPPFPSVTPPTQLAQSIARTLEHALSTSPRTSPRVPCRDSITQIFAHGVIKVQLHREAGVHKLLVTRRRVVYGPRVGGLYRYRWSLAGTTADVRLRILNAMIRE